MTACDFTATLRSNIGINVLENSIVISADVIEHIPDPQKCYFDTLRYVLDHAPAVVLSTPDRERGYIVNGPIAFPKHGPPSNQHHVREHRLGELELMLAANGMYAALGGWNCRYFRGCPVGLSKAYHNYTHILIVIWNTNQRRTWMQPIHSVISITAFVVVHPNTNPTLIQYNLAGFLEQNVKIVLLSYGSSMDQYKVDNVITVQYVSSLEDVKQAIIKHIRSAIYSTEDWFMVIDGHDILTTIRNPYINVTRSIRDMITHIGQSSNQYNAIAVTSVFLHNARAEEWSDIHPFKIHSLGSWDDGQFQTLKPLNPPQYNVKIWKNTLKSQKSLHFEVTTTIVGDKIIYGVNYQSRVIYPYNVIAWRCHTEKTLIDDHILDDMELHRLYTYEFAFQFFTSDRHAMTEISWLY